MPASGRRPRLLLAVAVVEAVTLAVLLINRFGLQLPDVASAVGPIHGSAYLVGLIAVWTAPYSVRVRLLALLPGVGALLAAGLATREGRATPEGERFRRVRSG